jgi:hypothetical protein
MLVTLTSAVVTTLFMPWYCLLMAERAFAVLAKFCVGRFAFAKQKAEATQAHNCSIDPAVAKKS